MILKKFRVGKEKLNNLVIAEGQCVEKTTGTNHILVHGGKPDQVHSLLFLWLPINTNNSPKVKANSCFISLQAKGLGKAKVTRPHHHQKKKPLEKKNTCQMT